MDHAIISPIKYLSQLNREFGLGLHICYVDLAHGYKQYRDFYIAPSITASHEDVSTDATASSALKRMDGTYSNLDFAYGLILDMRNQPFQPTDGYRTKFIQSLPLIMDSSSLLNGLTVSSYHSLSDDVIGTIKFLGHTIHGLNNEDVRLTKRLRLPQNRLRGFSQASATRFCNVIEIQLHVPGYRRAPFGA